MCEISGKSNQWSQEHVILAPENHTVFITNEKILDILDAQQETYLSVDPVVERYEATDYPVEFLNSSILSGLPPHKLDLKIGAPIILVHDLNASKLYNGTKLRIKSLKRCVIETDILSGRFKDDIVFIPRIPLNSF